MSEARKGGGCCYSTRIATANLLIGHFVRRFLSFLGVHIVNDNRVVYTGFVYIYVSMYLFLYLCIYLCVVSIIFPSMTWNGLVSLTCFLHIERICSDVQTRYRKTEDGEA